MSMKDQIYLLFDEGRSDEEVATLLDISEETIHFMREAKEQHTDDENS